MDEAEVTLSIQRTTRSIERAHWNLQRVVRDLGRCAELAETNNAALGEPGDELKGLFGLERADALRLVTD